MKDVIATIKLRINTNKETEEEAIESAEDFELPDEYIEELERRLEVVDNPSVEI